MRKLLFLILLLPAMAWGQLPSLSDTTLISPSTSFTAQWRYSLFGGDIIPQAYINGKYFFMPTNKYLSKYYASLNGANSFTNINTWAVGNTQGGYLTNGFYSLFSDTGLGGYALFQGNGSGGTNLTFLMRPDGNATDAFNRLQFNNTSVNITTPNGHGLEYSSAKAAFNPSDSSYVTKAWVRARGTSDSTAIASTYKLKSDSTGANGYQTQYRTDLRYLKLTGGTLSGNITAPTANITGTTTSTAANPLFATVDATTGLVGKSALVVSTNPNFGNISPAIVMDMNTVANTALGFYSSTSTNTPFSGVGGGLTIALNGSFQNQLMFSRTGNSLAQRANNNGVWSAWIIDTKTAGVTYTYPTVTSTIYSTASGSITSAQLATSLTNETGSGVAVFDNAPSIQTPLLNNIKATSTYQGGVGTTADSLRFASSNRMVEKALIAGNGIGVVQAANSVTISATGNPIVEITGTTQTAAANTIYIPHNAAVTTISIPATTVIGSLYQVIGEGAGGWKFQFAAGQTAKGVGVTTTSGGSIASTDRYCTLTVRLVAANTFVITTSQGTLTPL